MPARSELNRRDFLQTASGIALLPNLKPNLAPSAESKETTEELIFGQAVLSTGKNKATIVNLYTGDRRDLSLPYENPTIFLGKISPDGTQAAVWSGATTDGMRGSAQLLIVDLTNPNSQFKKIFETSNFPLWQL